MDNFFNSSSPDLNLNISLHTQYDELKDNYQKIFTEAASHIRASIGKFKPEKPCEKCRMSKECTVKNKGEIFSDYPRNCAYKDWQAQVITYLSGDYTQRLKKNYELMMNLKNACSCNKCGECCRLATSKYSYEQLKQRAFKGDKYSMDFVSVFVPFEKEEDAKKVNPEYCAMLDELHKDEKIYFYYCPKLKNNECSDYENRPNICREFPHNPLKLLPSNCSFNEWKNKISHNAMLLNAKIDIIKFYKMKLG